MVFFERKPTPHAARHAFRSGDRARQRRDRAPPSSAGAELHAPRRQRRRLAGADHAGARLARRGPRLPRPPCRAGSSTRWASCRRSSRSPTAAPCRFRGVHHRIRHVALARGTVTVDRRRRVPVMLVAGRPEYLRRRVVDFLKREASRDLERAALRHAMMLGVRVKAIRLRDQVSRWGSCTATGHLSFSWRLDHGAALRPRLPRRPRSGASPGDEPLPSLLAPGRVGLQGDASAPAPGSTRKGRGSTPSGSSRPSYLPRNEQVA